MLNLDPGKLLVIGVVAIILLGPDRLPQVARQLGGAWRSFNEFRHRMESEVRNTMPDLPPTSEIARLARSPSALLNHLSNMSSEDGERTEDGEEPDGSFQPPTLTDENGTADAAAWSAETPAMPATNGNGPVPTADDADTGVGGQTAPAEGTAAAPQPVPTAPESAPMPTPKPMPTPNHADGRSRAPQGSGVVVPGDPTLN
jgi:sec-independent protein translocase protein TatB